jgi:hypothetical protein
MSMNVVKFQENEGEAATIELDFFIDIAENEQLIN